MDKHLKTLNLLYKMACDLPKVAQAKLACAILHKNEIISFGFNQYKTHPFQKKFSSNPHAIYLHAETHAIHNALKRIDVETLKKCTLYICRAKNINNKKGMTWGLSKPCMGCSKAICQFEIKNVIYSLDEEYKYSIL